MKGLAKVDYRLLSASNRRWDGHSGGEVVAFAATARDGAMAPSRAIAINAAKENN